MSESFWQKILNIFLSVAKENVEIQEPKIDILPEKKIDILPEEKIDILQPKEPIMLTVKKGDGITNKASEAVQAVIRAQAILGIGADGKFGSGTETAVKAFQKKNNLPESGIVDDATWKALFTHEKYKSSLISTFNFDFSRDKLAIFLVNKEASLWYDALVEVLPKFRIYTRERVCAFLAQCSHESNNFSSIQENLNYSKDALLKIFKKYFPDEATAEAYARKPEKIANRVYGGRMGNGPESSGDGWKFRGRGLIQLTGKNNYTNCSIDVFGDNRLLDNPDLLSSKEGAIQSACWYWKINNLNENADSEDMVLLTKKINGGTHGLDDRISRYEKAKKIFDV